MDCSFTLVGGTKAGGGFVFDTSWIEGEIFVNNLSPVKDNFNQDYKVSKVD